jgi:uncharacterized surface protein with fasciclin (FAS1) repeats
MKLKSLLSALLMSAVVITSCDDAADNDVVAKLATDPTLTQLATAIKAAGLESQLKSATNITLFAPNNAALASLPGDITGARLENLLKYHVATELVVPANLTGANDSVAFNTLLANNQIFVTSVSAGVFINGNRTVTTAIRSTAGGIPAFKGHAQVVKTIEAGNGVIHVVDGILYPDAELTVLEAALKRYYVSRAASAVVAANLANASSPLAGAGPVTLLAPVNAPNSFGTGNTNAFAFIDSQGINLTVGTDANGNGVPDNLEVALACHILPGNVTAANIAAATTIPTAASIPGVGTVNLNVLATSPVILLRSALISPTHPAANALRVPVVGADVVCKNGRLHFIGNLILPVVPS